MAKIESKAAGLLASNGRTDDAVRLYERLNDWERLVALLLKEAPVMLGQGRHQTLAEWLDSVPARIGEENPWLLYWRGSCHMPFDQEKSRSCFAAAHAALCAKKDAAGAFMSWCGMVEAAVHGFDGKPAACKVARTLSLTSSRSSRCVRSSGLPAIDTLTTSLKSRNR